jgi:FkbM family methyltransferase
MRLPWFEASEACCLVVRENALLNRLESKIRVVNAVVADKSGGPLIFNWDFVSGNSSIVMPSLTGRQLPFFKAALSLDDFVQTSGLSPDFVKIDVEGAELNVLRGMTRIFQDYRPEIWMEVHAWPTVSLADRISEASAIASASQYEMLHPQTKARVDPTATCGVAAADAYTRCHVILIPQT